LLHAAARALVLQLASDRDGKALHALHLLGLETGEGMAERVRGGLDLETPRRLAAVEPGLSAR
jgi:hypothetical protein